MNGMKDIHIYKESCAHANIECHFALEMRKGRVLSFH